MSSSRPGSLGEVYRNFRDYDAPLTAKLRMFVSNNWKKARSRAGCCGNEGEPGC